MQLDKDFYTVQETAVIIGKTTQAVYSKLDTLCKEGKDYTITGTDGKKRVKREFISDYYGDIVTVQQQEQEQAAAVNEELAAIRAENNALHNQIEQLQDRIQSQQRTIEQLEQMNINNQLLLSQMSKNQTLMLQTSQDKEEQGAEQDADTVTVKKSFWQRFKK